MDGECKKIFQSNKKGMCVKKKSLCVKFNSKFNIFLPHHSSAEPESALNKFQLKYRTYHSKERVLKGAKR
jgi:hypothetical protein